MAQLSCYHLAQTAQEIKGYTTTLDDGSISFLGCALLNCSAVYHLQIPQFCIKMRFLSFYHHF